METQVIDRPVAAAEADASLGGGRRRKAVVSIHRGVLVCLEMDRVQGCVPVEKLTRLPGSHGRVAGILLFRGRPVPVVSLGHHSTERHRRRQKSEEHALIVSARGREFALEVDGVPAIFDGPFSYSACADVPCVMRARHIDKFLATCVLHGDVPDCGPSVRGG